MENNNKKKNLTLANIVTEDFNKFLPQTKKEKEQGVKPERDFKPVAIVLRHLREQQEFLRVHDEYAEKIRPLYFLLDVDPVEAQNWILKACALLDDGTVKVSERANIIIRLLEVKRYYMKKYSKAKVEKPKK